MSTPSKKRRKAREWMERTLEQHAKHLLHINDEAARRVELEHKRYEAVVTPDGEGTITPLGRPDQLHYKVAAAPGMRGRIFNPKDLRYYDRLTEYVFRVRQHAHRLPCGTTVVWYGLEFCG